MALSTFAVIISTLLGPVLAVQAQKWIERARARSDDKEKVFRVLMSTRAARLSDEHVRALNMIDIAFRAGQPSQRSAEENEVVKRWAEYRGHLSIDQTGATDIQQQSWSARANDHFLAMLDAMAKERGYDADKHALSVGGYHPIAHGYAQSQQEYARLLLLEVLRGDRPITMAIKEMPEDPGWKRAVLDELENISQHPKCS